MNYFNSCVARSASCRLGIRSAPIARWRARGFCSGVAVGVAVAVFSTGCGQRTQTALPSFPPVAVTVAKPLQKEVVNYAEYIANTAAVNSVDIRARVSGYLDKLGFNEGAIVKAGDVLFVIDPRPYQAALDQAQANVEQAKAQLQLAQSNFDRAEDLRKKGVISPQDYETQSANKNQAQATLLANQAALETAKLNVDFTQVRSPIDGRTSTYSYTVGNLIAAGDTSSSGVLTSVVSVDPMYVYFNVDERGMLAYMELIRQGKVAYTPGAKPLVEMQLANENDFPHKGFIDFVDNRVDPSTGTIRVRGVFPNQDGLLRPGLFVRVRLPAGPKYTAELISDLAVAYDQGQPIVYVVGPGDVATAKPVRLGALSEGLRVVDSGVSPDDRIVVNGIVHLRPGIRVTLQEGNMAEFAGGIRQELSVAPAGTSGQRGGRAPQAPSQPAPQGGKSD
ncbi:MAG: efflux RND transporter periplasmic adaptor subunit [Verrucomicrobia bacterium]|nr:efflux RND transporter periplasmic adaptor subunit [Verrucomicrobiota bacterium]